MVATSYPPRVRTWDSSRRFMAVYDLHSTPPRMTSVVPLMNPWLAACAAAAPYGFIGTEQGDLHWLDLGTQHPRPCRMGAYGHPCPEILECSDDGRLVLIAALAAQLWDRESGQLQWQREDIWVKRAVFVPQSHRLICGLATGEIQELDAATGQTRRQLSLHRSQIRSLSVSPCGEYLASTAATGECVISRLDNGEVLWTRRYRHDALAEFAADGDSVVVANAFRGCSLATADAATGDPIMHGLVLSSTILKVRPVADGTVFLTSGQPFVTAWRPDTGESYRLTPSIDFLYATARDSANQSITP